MAITIACSTFSSGRKLEAPGILTDSIDYERLARFYDALVTTTMDIGFFSELAENVDGPVLELMAGSGRVSVPLAQAGVILTCVDRSPAMLSLLREKTGKLSVPPVIVEADVRELELASRFNLVLLPFNSFLELLTDVDRKRAMKTAHSHLAPGGRFVCTLHNPAVRLKKVDGLVHFVGVYPMSDGSSFHFSMVERVQGEEGLVAGFEYFEEYASDGRLRSKTTVPLSYCLLERDRFKKLAERTGLEVVQLYGDYDKSKFDPKKSPFMIWILKAQTSRNESVAK